ncbi:hypothetical protein [Fournierella sp.]|uniref:hypothetical protein n=1 Tax=Allofournierella sp. TaxID=1940256 RepID=UPI003079177A
MKKNKIRKNLLSAMACLILMYAFAVPCFAQESSTVIASYTEDLGNGITVVTTITENTSRSTKSHSKNKNYYYSGQWIGQATLSASFYYDGSVARATEVYGNGNGANGWSYGSQTVDKSGNTAYLSARLSMNGRSVPVEITFSCSPDGSIS